MFTLNSSVTLPSYRTTQKTKKKKNDVDRDSSAVPLRPVFKSFINSN